MTRAEAAAAVKQAAETVETWRATLAPEADAAWDLARSRELDAAEEAVARLRELAAGLEPTR